VFSSFLGELERLSAKIKDFELEHKRIGEDYGLYAKQANRDIPTLKSKIKRFTESTRALDKMRSCAAALNLRIDNNIQAVMKDVCQSTCAQVMTKLPRELRDEVYAAIHGSGLIFVAEDTSEGGIVAQMGLPMVYGWAQTTTVVLPIRTLESWLGTTTARELIEHWYHDSVFHFGVRTHHLRPFITDDVLGSGLHPAQFIKRASITLQYLFVNYTGSETARDIPNAIATTLRSHEGSLLGFQPGTHLQIFVEAGYCDMNNYVQVDRQCLFDKMVWILINLLMHGYHLTLNFHGMNDDFAFRSGNYTREMLMKMFADEVEYYRFAAGRSSY